MIVGSWHLLTLALPFSLLHAAKVWCLFAISRLLFCLNQPSRNCKEAANLNSKLKSIPRLALRLGTSLQPLDYTFRGWMAIWRLQKGTNLLWQEGGRGRGVHQNSEHFCSPNRDPRVVVHKYHMQKSNGNEFRWNHQHSVTCYAAGGGCLISESQPFQHTKYFVQRGLSISISPLFWVECYVVGAWTDRQYFHSCKDGMAIPCNF